MLDPAYSEEFEQLKADLKNNTNLYHEEMAKISLMKDNLYREYQRKSQLIGREYDFIRDHPSSIELERRACIAQLVESGDWVVCVEPHRIAARSWFMVIMCNGFPTTLLTGQKEIPPIAQNLEKYGFEIYIKQQGAWYIGPN